MAGQAEAARVQEKHSDTYTVRWTFPYESHYISNGQHPS